MKNERLINLSLRLLQASLPLLRCVPSGPAARLSGSLAGLVGSQLQREIRIAKTQLQVALGVSDAEAKRIARQCFQELGVTVMELIHSEKLLPSKPRSTQVAYRPTSFITCDKGEKDDMLQLAASGRAFVALGSHAGNFELQAAFYARCGVPLSVIGRKPNYVALAEFAEAVRSSHDLRNIWREDPASARLLLKTIKENGALGALLDQDIQAEHGYAPFFGIPASIPLGPIRLAVRYKLPIIYSFSVRSKPLYHVLYTGRIDYDIEAPKEESIQAVMSEYHKQLEHFIRRNPEQWVWWHRRWRRQRTADSSEQAERVPSTKEYLTWLQGNPSRSV